MSHFLEPLAEQWQPWGMEMSTCRSGRCQRAIGAKAAYRVTLPLKAVLRLEELGV